jgi:asparagine synthase (glutamine-hydrolysing)
VAARHGLPLVEISRDRSPIDDGAFSGLASGARPGLTGMDVHYDRNLGERSAEVGAQAIFTGQGGDAVFFQMPTPLVAAELLTDPRSRREKGALLMSLAHWTRQPIWTLLPMLWRCRRSALQLSTRLPPFVSRREAPYFSPWLDGTTHLPPAKRLQMWGLANSRLYFGESYRSRHADVVHPLMSQPLVEHVLAIPVLDLTRARRDRAPARQAFTARLPEEVIARRGKGDLTSYYGRLVAASLGFLRPHLLDGCLAREGLIARPVLDAMLDPQRLIHEDHYAELLSAAIIEAWVRTWEARVAGLEASGGGV